MATRGRISDRALGSYEDAIAYLVRIERRVAQIEMDLDIDSRRYHRRSFGDILDAAASVRQFVIGKMQAEKSAAREGRGQ
jgi:hypothetical protein